MVAFSSTCRRALVASLLLLPGLSASALAEVPIDPEGPYRMGEGYADVPATCETISHWIDRAPDTRDRVTMTITGRLTSIDWDGALAYLVMCGPDEVQVMCVTYSKEDREIGQAVLFAGGFSRWGERQVMLDPCLVDPL